MTYHNEHRKIKPALDLAREYDIASNPDPQALFEAGSGGFQVWCVPEDHPAGWDEIRMYSGAFAKPCEYVGSVTWKWEEEIIIGLDIETDAYALRDQQPRRYPSYRGVVNRPEDIAWIMDKIAWLFEKAGMSLPPIYYEETQPSTVEE